MFGYLSGKMLDLFNVFGGKTKLSDVDIEKAIFSIQETLVSADVPFKIVKNLSSGIREDLLLVNKNSTVDLHDRLQAILFNRLLELTGGKKDSKEEEFSFLFKKGSVVLVAGLQGAGKTTSIAKLAYYLRKEQGFKKFLATSLDFVRPAAVEQLSILCEKAEIEFLAPDFGNISTSLSRAKQAFLDGKYDCLFVDTPGRLHINNELMSELQVINSVLEPAYKFLVIDSMTGQESLNVARAFNDILDITGSILTKADSDSKGGVALSFFSELKKPVLFLGNGEKITDLEKFIPKRIVSRMLGSGDILTLVESIDKKIGVEDGVSQEAAQKRFTTGTHHLQDFLDQMELISSLGSLQKIMSYLPGFGKVSSVQINQAEVEIKKLKSMIHSMTPKERLKPEILNHSRRIRIARGAGLSEADISSLLNKFEESKRYAKLFSNGSWKGKF